MQISLSNIRSVAQVVVAIKDGVEKLDKAYENRDLERVNRLKKELLKLNESLESLLK